MRKIQRSNTLLILLIALNIASAIAASSEPASDSVKYYFNPIIKTATKIDGAQRDLAASISLIDGAKLDLAPTNAVLDIVKTHVPGLYVTEWGVMGFGVAGEAAGKISIRGMGGGANTHVLILRNGRPDFMGLMGCTIADEFSTDGVERIEVIRGPGSFLYGTNATGGIINIISKKVRKPGYQTNISSGYGTYYSHKLFASHGGKIGNFDYYLTAANRKTDGHRDDANSYYEAEHYTVHLGYALGNNTTIAMNSSLANINLNDPGQVTSPKFTDWYDMRRYGGDLTLVHQSRLGESHLKLHGNFGRHKFFDGWRSHDRTLGFMVYQNTKPWQDNTTTIGFDYKRYGGDAIDTSTDYGEFFITEYAPYIHVQQLLLKRLILSAGLRVEHHELYGNEVLPKAGLVYHLFESTALRLSAAKGFRSPSIRELYFWLPANEELDPDRMWNYEIGLSQHVGRRMNIDVALFQSEGENLIQFSAPPPKWINSGEYTHTGYEIMFNWLPVDDLELGASWTKLDLSEGVYNTPGKKATVYANYQIGRLKFYGNLVHIRDWFGAEFKGPRAILHPMDDYTVINLSARVAIFKGIGFKATLKNALNVEYQSMYGYPMPGRHMFFDIIYDF